MDEQPTPKLRISRPIIESDHEALREYMSAMDHTFPDFEIKWRKLGRTGMTLIREGEFLRLTEIPGSRLAGKDYRKLADTIDSSIIPKMPTEGHPFKAEITGVEFFGKNSPLSIVYLVAPGQPQEERERLSGLLDRMNNRNFRRWGSFAGHIAVASIEAKNANERVLRVFSRIQPESINLHRAHAIHY